MAVVAADTVQDIVFGITTIVGGFEIVAAAVKKQLASSLAFLTTAIGVYGTFYL